MRHAMDAKIKEFGSRYSLVILAAKRARQINNYLNAIRRAEPTDFQGPELDMIKEKPLTIAFREIAEGKIVPDHLPDRES